MKLTYVLLLIGFTRLFSFGQNVSKMSLHPASSNVLTQRFNELNTSVKTILCQDTLRYPQAKEQILGTNNFYSGFSVWQSDNESISQAYLNNGTLTITGVEFFGARSASGSSTVTVNASVYNVDASNVPTTLIGGGNVTITSTTYGYVYANFTSAVNVTGNYAIVLKPTNAGGILNLYVNDIAVGQSYDELLARFYSSYVSYPNPNNWNTIPTFEGGAANYEALISPIVNYSLNTDFTPSATSVCVGSPVTYTNATAPMGVLSSRMNNYQVFRSFFGTAPSDSTFVYDMDNSSPLIWTGTTTYTHPLAGTYDVLLATNGGFWNSCFDFKTRAITVVPLDNAAFTYPTNSICSSAGNQVPTTSTSGTFSATPAGLNFVSTASGEINVSTSSLGSFTVTYNTNGTCPNNSSQLITITTAPDATFTYGNTSYCSADVDPTPVFAVGANAGTFSSTPGLVFISTNSGVVDLSASTPGSYVITNSIAASGTCSASNANFTILIKPTPILVPVPNSNHCPNQLVAPVSFSSSPVGALVTWTNDNTSTGLGASGVGLVPSFFTPNVTNTEISTVSYSANLNGCFSATYSYTVTVNPNPIATINSVNTLCSNDGVISLTGNPAGGSFSGSGVTGNGFDPSIGSGNYTVIYTVQDANGCNGTASTIVQVNQAPTVSMSPLPDVCSDANAFALTGGFPSGGTYSGTGVSNGVFDPSQAGTGSFNVSYEFIDANGCSSSDTVVIIVNDCASLDDLSNMEIVISPNPSDDFLVLSVKGAVSSDLMASIYSEDGKQILSPTELKNNANTFDISGFASGIYLIQIQSLNSFRIEKLIVK